MARSTAGEQPTQRKNQVAVAEFLVRQHFSVPMSERVEEGKPAIAANSGSSRMLVVKSPALGWDRDLIRRYVDAQDRVFVVFRWHIYSISPPSGPYSTRCGRGFAANWFQGVAQSVLAVGRE
jgi:hypothetical protein